MKFSDLSRHRRSLRNGSRSFFAASLLLPARLSDPASVLYAFCRMADDLIDESDDPHGAVAQLQTRLDAMYRGQPGPDPLDADFARLVHNYDIPKALPQALLEGFLWDAQGRDYDTIEELYEYAARVAGTVGVMMTILMGVRSAPALARAADLGVAMQLTNIARDVAEDAERGRLYLPTQWMREAGLVPEQWLVQPGSSHALSEVVARLLQTADDFYHRADAGVGYLPRDCRFGIRCARGLYSQIGRQLESNGLDPFAGRAIVAPRTKIAVVLRMLGASFKKSELNDSAPITQTAFLVNDAARPELVATQALDSADLPLAELRGSYARVLSMLIRLEAQDKKLRSATP